MASESPLKDIDDKFCLCSICSEQLKEPKLLPCLHSFCKDCLNTLIQASSAILNCPVCREEIQIPTNGVDGFKTDIQMKNLVECVQIQHSLQSEEKRKCCGCSNELKVTAYCFKCNDFICKSCHNYHLTNELLKDHQKHTLYLEDIESKNITIEKLDSMRGAPRCHIHPEEIPNLFCETCNDLVPVCVACMFRGHKGHNLYEVKALANSKRKLLAEKLSVLENLRKENKVTIPGQAKEMLNFNVTSEKEKLFKIYEDKVQKTKNKIQDGEEMRERIEHEIKNTEKQISDLQREMEQEIQGVKKKYEEMFKVKRNKLSDTFEAQKSSVEKDLAQLNEKIELFDGDKKELLDSLKMQLNKNLKDIDEISGYLDNIDKRYWNLQVLAKTITESKNYWTAVQCIPDMNTASDKLIKDLKREFPELTTLTNVRINYKQSSLGQPSVTKISQEVEKKISINYPCYSIRGVTRSGDGNIVMSGCSGEEQPFGNRNNKPFIIVFDENGKIIRQKKLEAEIPWPWHFCDFLSLNKVATVYRPHTIGVYNVLDDSYIWKNISDVISNCPTVRDVSCVATDPVNNHILVGGYKSRDVYVFDNKLNYLHTLTLPEVIEWPKDITVSDGHLLVCDDGGKRAYVTIMAGLENKLVGEFMKPNLEGSNFGPISACKDKNGCVYMLWKNFVLFPRECYLVQYIHDGSQILAMRKLDGDASVVTTVETSQGEKLVVATYNTQTVYLYDLMKED